MHSYANSQCSHSHVHCAFLFYHVHILPMHVIISLFVRRCYRRRCHRGLLSDIPLLLLLLNFFLTLYTFPLWLVTHIEAFEFTIIDMRETSITHFENDHAFFPIHSRAMDYAKVTQRTQHSTPIRMLFFSYSGAIQSMEMLFASHAVRGAFICFSCHLDEIVFVYFGSIKTQFFHSFWVFFLLIFRIIRIANQLHFFPDRCNYCWSN